MGFTPVRKCGIYMGLEHTWFEVRVIAHQYFCGSQKPGGASEGRSGDYSDNTPGKDLYNRALNTFRPEFVRKHPT